ncbi:MAG TPA: methylated-DNA--[protein]-cysteine S-methyltransferase [Nitrospiraceae bacterium]|nr:methylated-DNA--[protein]-cysteine S-methyltransferase [Nitrospiraceae bacterium]
MEEHRAAFHTQWGWIELAASEKGVTSIVLPLSSRAGRNKGRVGMRKSQPNGPATSMLDEAKAQLIEYLAGARREFSMPLDMSEGTPFQRRVWRAILRIPYGRVRSYQWVAEKVGGKQYARAVGMALGANPVPIVVPCHRIISHDGSLGGFGCGLPMKRRLLKLERTL